MKQFALKSLAISVASLALIAGCEKSETTSTPSAEAPAAGPKVALPADFILAEQPAGVQDLAAVKEGELKDGDEVVVRLIAGGSENPFVANRAMVQVIDPSVTTCDKMGDDACKTPWDACCHPDEVRAKGATVQVVDAGGDVLKGTLDGVGGLKPGKEFVVKGKAKWEAEGKNLLINATNIYVKS